MKKGKAPHGTVYVKGDDALVQEFLLSLSGKGFDVKGTATGRGSRSGMRARGPRTVRIPRAAHIFLELSEDAEVKRNNLRRLDREAAPSAVILSSSVLTTVAEQSTWVRKPERLVGISAFPTLLQGTLIEASPSLHTDARAMVAARDFFRKIGKELCVVQDRIGMVMPRILCMIINEAAFALTEQIASPSDIDLAMKLGTNYPRGPIEWGEKIGFERVERVLEALREDLGEERYRPAPLLRQLSIGRGFWQQKPA